MTLQGIRADSVRHRSQQYKRLKRTELEDEALTFLPRANVFLGEFLFWFATILLSTGVLATR